MVSCFSEEPINKRCNPAGHDGPAELQGRTEESYTNCAWPRNSVLAVTIQLFNANKNVLDPPFAVIQLSNIQIVKDMHTRIDIEVLKSSVVAAQLF